MITQRALRVFAVCALFLTGCAAATSDETIQVGYVDEQLPELLPFEAELHQHDSAEGMTSSDVVPAPDGFDEAFRGSSRLEEVLPLPTSIPVERASDSPSPLGDAVGVEGGSTTTFIEGEPLPVEQTTPPTSSSSPVVGDSGNGTPATTVRAQTTTTARAQTTTTARAQTTTTARATTTTVFTSPSSTSTTSSVEPATVATPGHDPLRASFQPSLSSRGWIVPNPGVNVGHPGSPARGHLFSFVEPNDGPHGVTIDQAFLTRHAGAPWLLEEDGRPVISGVEADGLCLNVTVRLTLRNSYVNCPTRTQSSSWGWAGDVDDAPAVNILNASGVVVEFNTITCSGSDGDICSRSVRVSGPDAIVRYNDLSFARGAVKLADGTQFVHNFVHSFSFGFDPRRASNPNDRVTHNNAVNSYGYSDTLVEGNYIIARYGRVSAAPSTYTNPYFRLAYPNGVVSVGDPINGFAFVNYLHEGSGSGSVTLRNYVEGAGRAFLCNASNKHANAVCAAEMSHNYFADDTFDLFQQVPIFQDLQGNGSIGGRCNGFLAADGSIEVFGSDAFGRAGQHGRSGC